MKIEKHDDGCTCYAYETVHRGDNLEFRDKKIEVAALINGWFELSPADTRAFIQACADWYAQNGEPLESLTPPTITPGAVEAQAVLDEAEKYAKAATNSGSNPLEHFDRTNDQQSSLLSAARAYYASKQKGS